MFLKKIERAEKHPCYVMFVKGVKEEQRRTKGKDVGTKRNKDKCKDQPQKNPSLTCQHGD